jgi:hypothetical protein
VGPVRLDPDYRPSTDKVESATDYAEVPELTLDDVDDDQAS